jgi:hypothetical protein
VKIDRGGRIVHAFKGNAAASQGKLGCDDGPTPPSFAAGGGVYVLVAVPVVPFALICAVLVCLLVPRRWGWRVVAAIGLAFWAFLPFGRALRDQVTGQMATPMQLAVGALLVGLALALRLMSRHRGGAETARANAVALTVFDTCLATGGGIVLGAAGFVSLAWVFQGHDGGMIMTLAIAGGGLGLVGLAARRAHAHRRVALASLGATVAALAILGATAFPARLRANAEFLANGAPYCVALINRGRPPANMHELALLTIDKSENRHHAILLIGAGTGAKVAHWSYWRMAFMPGVRRPQLPDGIPCIPRRGFFDTLGVSQDTLVSLPSGAYSIPAEFNARIGRDLSVQVDAVTFGPPRGLDQITTVTLLTRQRPGPVADVLAAASAAPAEFGLARYDLPGRKALYLSGTVAAPDTSIWCDLSFGSRSRPCRMEFQTGKDAYGIDFLSTDLERWRVMRSRAILLFARFRQKD